MRHVQGLIHLTPSQFKLCVSCLLGIHALLSMRALPCSSPPIVPPGEREQRGEGEAAAAAALGRAGEERKKETRIEQQRAGE